MDEGSGSARPVEKLTGYRPASHSEPSKGHVMTRTRCIIAACAAAVLLSIASAGCTRTITAQEFIAKYTSNVEVPNPNYHQLPIREFLGQVDQYYYLKDRIPFGQGAGFFGQIILWRCPVVEMPKDFPEAYRPGDLILDARPGAKHTFLIELYEPPPAPARPSPKRPAKTTRTPGEPTATRPAAK